MQYQLDDTLLLKSYLYRHWNDKDLNGFWNGGFELIIRPECNQKCDYCYITKYGDELYPKKFRKNNQELLNNLNLLLEYLTDNKIYCKHWELFAGDLFYDNLWFDIIDIFYDYYNKLEFFSNFRTNIREEDKNKTFVKIIMPCNCSFFHSEEKTNKIGSYIEKMKKIGIHLGFSWSHDGPALIDIREKRDIDEEYYRNAFNFLNKYHYGAHPMISYEGIDHMIENYNWWLEQWEKIGKTRKEGEYELSPMFLEVRNEGWTDEKIQKYLEFLDYAVKHRFEKVCQSNPVTMAYNIFFNNRQNKAKVIPEVHHTPETPNDFISIKITELENSYQNCSLGRTFNINLAKMTIVPCHRLSYEFYEAGHFVINSTNEEVEYFKDNKINEYLKNKIVKNNEKIVDIVANESLSAYLNIVSAKPMFSPKCCVCNYRQICLKGCYGAQFETYGDWSMPVPDVCKLLKSKYDFLIDKYVELGVMEVALKSEFPLSKKEKNALLEMIYQRSLEIKNGNK